MTKSVEVLRWNWALNCLEILQGKVWKTVKGGKKGMRRAFDEGGRVTVSETVG